MPNRIIKESAFTSDRIAELSDFEFRLWVGLITQADDAGRGDARPAIIKGRVFALRERTTSSDIDKALHALAAHGCVDLYEVDGKPYYEFPSWANHQRIRDAKSKYPSKEEGNAISPQLAATRRETPPKSNPIQSNPNPNPNPTPHAQPRAGAGAREGESEIEKALEQFFSMRAEKGRACTKIEKENLLKELNNYPESIRLKIVKQSITHGWLGFYPLKEEKPAGKIETGASYDIEAAEARMRTSVPQLRKKGETA